MGLFRRVSDWLLYSSVFAAICAVSLCVATEKLILGQLPQPSALHLFIVGSTLMVYNAHHLIRKAAPERSDRYRWTAGNSIWHWIVFIAGLALFLWSMPALNVATLTACLVLGVLSFGYTLPILPLGRNFRLRDHGLVKIIILTLVWSISTTIVPMLFHEIAPGDFPLEILLRTTLLFCLCVAFDLRDMQTDFHKQIYTIPNLIGVRSSYRLMYSSLVFFAVLALMQFLRLGNERRLIADFVQAVVTAGAVYGTRYFASDKYYLGVIDGMMLLYGCLVAFLGHYH